MIRHVGIAALVVVAGTPVAALDSSTPAARAYSILSPDLRQVFFIGHGTRRDLR